MNEVERALMHALFVHLHHNIDQAIDFKAMEKLNEEVAQAWPGALQIGPHDNDDAAVVRIPGEGVLIAAKQESHCSPCVPRPYDGAATGAGGAMRDVTAMGARPLFLLDFIGTRPPEDEVVVGPCGFQGECTCGSCQIMTSQERLNIMLQGLQDMCKAMDVFIAGGGFSTSFSDIVPAVVVAVFGKLVVDKPLTKPAKSAGDKIVVIGETGNDGNDTLYRAGLVSELRPAEALFAEERRTLDATLAAFQAGKVNACSDLGAAGIGAAVCESARFGGFGAQVDLAKVPVKSSRLSPEEILICETQARMVIQVPPGEADAIMNAARSCQGAAAVIGEITADDQVHFTYDGCPVATIPNKPSAELLRDLKGS